MSTSRPPDHPRRPSPAVAQRPLLLVFTGGHLPERRAVVRGAADVHQDGAAAARRRAGVWSVAMVFFQAALLAGYGYAHLLTRYAPGRRSVIIQLGVMVVACFCCRSRSRAAGAGRPRSARRSGCSACSRSRSGCRSSRSPPTRRCCRPGSRAPIIRRRTIPISSMPRATSAASWRCCPIRSLIEPFIRLTTRPGCGRSASIVLILLIARLRLPAVALARPTPPAAPASARRQAAEAAPPTWRDVATLGRPRGGAVGPAGRGDRAHLDRRRGGAAAVGHPARALSPHLRDRVLAQADHSALARGRGPAGLHPRAGRGHHLRADPDHRRPDRRSTSAVFFVMRADVPRRTRAAAAGGALSHRRSTCGCRSAA